LTTESGREYLECLCLIGRDVTF